MDEPTAALRCPQCEAPAVAGRFCAHCGSPLPEVEMPVGSDQAAEPAADASHAAWRTDTAERARVAVPAEDPAPPVVVPSHPHDVPLPPRYPLYADQVARPLPDQVPAASDQTPAQHGDQRGDQPGPEPVVQPMAPPPPATPLDSAVHRHRAPGAGLWAAAGAVLLAAVVLGGWLLLRGSTPDATGAQSSPLVPRGGHHSGSGAGSPHTATTTPPTASPTASPTSGTPTEVARLARASAPAHAPAGVDVDGRPVTFVAANLVDGSATTCWRRPGNGTGTVLTLRLDQPATLSSVGLINGYAKVAHEAGHRLDWYLGNRRVLAVQWIFDDGSRVDQQFRTSRKMQRMKIDPVTTSTVRIRITAVSPPGRGRAARNETAISEVSLIGRPSS